MTTRKFYEEELCELKQSLTSMCLAVERMIEDSIKALVEQDGELARSVVARDKRVDETELDIEKRCMRLLLIEQPVARDFREVSTALKLITDIERIGDQAADIAEIVSNFKDEAYIKRLTHTVRMGRLAVRMVHDGVASFINGDDCPRRRDGRAVFDGKKRTCRTDKKGQLKRRPSNNVYDDSQIS